MFQELKGIRMQRSLNTNRLNVRSILQLALVAGTLVCCLAGSGCKRKGHETTTTPEEAGYKVQADHHDIKFRLGEASTGGGQGAEPYSNGALGAMDVAGVKLGMMPEQALAALKTFDAQFSFSKRYRVKIASGRLVMKPESPEECTELSDNGTFALFGGLVAAKGATFRRALETEKPRTQQQLIESHFDEDRTCGDDRILMPGDAPVVVEIMFSAEPGNHHVIGIFLWRDFEKAPVTMDDIFATALKKYPFTVERKVEGTYCKSFRANGELVSGNTRDCSAERPGSVNELGGVKLGLRVTQVYDNALLAKDFTLSLYDEDALYQAVKKSDSIAAAELERRQKDEAAKARKSAAPVKM